MQFHEDRESQFGPLIDYARRQEQGVRYYLESYYYMGQNEGRYYYKHMESREYLVLVNVGSVWQRVLSTLQSLSNSSTADKPNRDHSLQLYRDSMIPVLY